MRSRRRVARPKSGRQRQRDAGLITCCRLWFLSTRQHVHTSARLFFASLCSGRERMTRRGAMTRSILRAVGLVVALAAALPAAARADLQLADVIPSVVY